MRIDVRHSPAYAIAYCQMDVGETLRAERGAMVSMSGAIRLGTDAGPGGIAKGLMRKALVNESVLMTRFTAQAFGAWVALASRFPGDVVAIDISEDTALVAESGSLLAISEGVAADPRWAGFRMEAVREGLTMLHLHGQGTAILAAYGGIEPFDLQDGQQLIFDTGHVVAYTASMQHRVKVGPLGGVATSVLSGEGLVAQMTGPGRVWTQTRSRLDLERWPQGKRSGRDQ